MNIDRILATLNRHGVACLLIGGMNFLLRHAPVLTCDLDVWIEDTPENRDRCEKALGELGAEWGTTQHDWRPVSQQARGWIERQAVFCLTSPHGAIDVFRSVRGLDSWAVCRKRAYAGRTSGGAEFHGLSDEDNATISIGAGGGRTQPGASADVARRDQASRKMTDEAEDELKRREERKREACWDPVERWRVLQETITWAESQATVRRNTPARCLELERAKLARL